MATKKKRVSRTQWFNAVRTGDLARVRAYIKAGVDVDLQSDDMRGATALMRASLDRADELMEVLIKAGASVNETDNLGSVALEYAAEAGNVKGIKLLLANGAKIESPDGKSSALIKAISQKEVDTALVLLQGGANPNWKYESGKTVLHEAAEAGLVPIIMALLKKGADVNAADSSGRTPLIYAAQSNRLEALEVLLAAGAEVHVMGDSVLAISTMRGSVELCEKLLQAGIDVNAIESDSGFDALTAASLWGRPELVRLFLKSGAKVRPMALKEARKRSSCKGVDECIRLLTEFKKTGKLSDAPPATQAKYPDAVLRMEKITGSKPKIIEPQLKGGYLFNARNEGRAQETAKNYRNEFLARGYYLFTYGNSVGLFPSKDKFDVVKAMQTMGVDGPDTEELIAWLKDLDKKQPFELIVIEPYSVVGEFLNPVKNPEGLAKKMIQICSDLISGGDTPARVAREIKNSGRFSLGWS